jgi:hypothetical protein
VTSLTSSLFLGGLMARSPGAHNPASVFLAPPLHPGATGIVTMLARYVFTGTTNLEQALHDALLEFNGDLADTVVAVAANADITFKPCQISSTAQKALDEEQAAVEVDLADFLRLLCGMVQIIDGHVRIRRSRADARLILDVRVVDSTFALVETDNDGLLQAFEARLTGAERSEPDI